MFFHNSSLSRFFTSLHRFIAFIILFLSITTFPLNAQSVWTETSDSDFSDGVFTLTMTSGTGSAAQLVLSPFGTGADGSVTISTTKNINTDIISSGRSYADGVNYSVTAIYVSSVQVSATPNGITTGDEVILINQQGDSTNYGNVGNYEFFRISNVSGNYLFFTSSITKIYGATTSNSNLTGQKVTIQRVPNWGNVTINSPGILTCSAWDGTKGGMVVFRATGTVSIGSGASIDVSGKGYRGGSGGTTSPTGGQNGESYDGFVGSGGNVNSSGSNGGGAGNPSSDNTPLSGSAGSNRGGGGGGGADVNTQGDDGAGAGGGGGYGGGGGGGAGGFGATGYSATGGTGGTTGQPAGGGAVGACVNSYGGTNGGAGTSGNGASGGAGGSGTMSGGGGGSAGANYGSGSGGGGGMYGTSELSKIYLGSGGGGGGGTSDTSVPEPRAGQTGGGGGGIIIVYSNFNTCAGQIKANGNTGGMAGANFSGGGGGGGAGGSIYLIASSITVSNVIVSTGGSSHGTLNARSSGGGGGVGRIRLDYQSLSGTTNPTHYAGSFPSGLPIYPATYHSNIIDTSVTDTRISTITWNPQTQPGGTTLTVSVRASNQPYSINSSTPSWSVAVNGQDINITGRYIQWMSTFTTTNSTTTPRIENIAIYYVSPPQSPTVQSINSPDYNKIVWCWSDPNSGATQETNYKIYSSSDGIISTLPPDTTYYIETGLSRNKTYSRYVQSYNAAGSSNSATVSWRTKPGTYQAKTSQGEPARTGQNSFGFVGDGLWEWQIPVKSGIPLTITCYIQYNTEYGGSATKPKLTLYGKGISPTSVSATAAAENAWELLTINAGTPSQDAMLKLKAEGFSTNPGARFYIDDIKVSQ